MDREFPIHPLENFPRQELSGRMSRRSFFMTIAAEFHLQAGQSVVASAVRIPTLGILTDNQLMDLIPCILSGCNIEIRGEEIWGKLENWLAANFLFRVDPLTSFCFNQVNGLNSLKSIAESIATESGLPFERAFAFTRGMFLTLVQAGVCLPVNTPHLG